MSKDFDAALSDAIELAAGAAHTAGASAARVRGRERTMRKRIIVSTTSFALVAAGAGAAFAVTSHHGGTPRVTAASPSVSASRTPSAGFSPTPTSGPTGLPITTASGTRGSASPLNTPSGPASTGATTSTATASEHWLTASQVLYDSSMNWNAGTPSSCPAGSYEIWQYYAGGCSEHTLPGDPHPAERMDTRVFGAPSVATGDGAWAGTTADQEFYTYASASDAQAAFEYFTNGILGEDSQFAGSTDAITGLAVTSTTTETAHADGAVAIDSRLRDSNGKPAEMNGNPSGASDRHYFFAVRGDIVEMVLITGGPAVSDASGDASYLQTVINALG
ncbi:hypothetical protein KDK95_04475 [Actinospica sp. MGRD01-02]|uniref:PknH-like extracellular domain-containing protein n=1 Tax=Actinospica acidithermotolerans TaxID=2828514 RepID=A0A941E8N9_9ACTN|nr:hypothetical protein [Actinospica acidithermotolerans]MBR7825550.1 hypothetical protein [Actinospica acidithermotolerans]